METDDAGRPRILSLCSGFGGLDMAVEHVTGGRMTTYAEKDPAASAVMAYRFSGVANIGDITTYDWTALRGCVDIVCAGFPCQDISNAGGRKGIQGERSGVWKHVAAAVGVLRPGIVFLENVAAIRSRGLDVVAEDLAAIGYDLRWGCFRASDVGAPHQRDRWFGVATPSDPTGVGRSGDPEPPEQPGSLRRVAGGGGEPPADADSARLEIRGVQPARGERPSIERNDPSAQDTHGAAGLERVGSAPGQAQGGRARPDAGRRGELSPAAWWGDYLPAIRRWECVTGIAAPEPTETGPRGGRRLAAPFAEWMMGLEPEWVTGVPGLTRSDQLKVIGNGVVPLQAINAYTRLLAMTPVVAEQLELCAV